jgi:hypothetical protein
MRIFRKVKQMFDQPTDVHYTSVPLWRPWRDFKALPFLKRTSETVNA